MNNNRRTGLAMIGLAFLTIVWVYVALFVFVWWAIKFTFWLMASLLSFPAALIGVIWFPRFPRFRGYRRHSMGAYAHAEAHVWR